MSGPSDRRDVDRVEVVLRVRYKTIDDFVVAYTADISRGGMFVSAENLRPLGSVVKLELMVPNKDPIRLIARVAHVRSKIVAEAKGKRPGMGMEFLDVDGAPIEEQLADLFSETSGPEVLQAAPARVVVADDMDSWRDQASEALRGQGHIVSTARNGVEALGLVLRDPPELIVSDVQMPGMDGWQLLRLIRARPTVAHIPVIFMTTLSGEAERLKGYQLGVDDYLPKPFESGELVARVQRVLGRSRMRADQSNRNALRGDLTQVALPSLLAFVELERRTGLLVVVADNGEMALMHVLEGRVMRVDLPDNYAHLDGLERVFVVLNWTEGWFELSAAEVSDKDDVGMGVSGLLMEHARRSDESSR